MPDTPFFSVIIPTYNRKKFTSEAIQSVLDQSYDDYEIIVVDDGSMDDTSSLFEDIDQRVRYIKQDNAGVSVARNIGVTNSIGEYVCYLDSDDLWHRDKLSYMHDFIHRYPQLDVFFHDFRKHNVELPDPYELSNTDMFAYLLTVFKQDVDLYWMSHGYDAFYLAMKGYPFYPSVITLKRAVHDQYRWDPGVLKSEDFNLILKLTLRYKFGYLNKDLATVRVHDNNKSADTLTKDRIVLQTMQLVANLYCPSAVRKAAKKIIASKFYHTGRSQLKSGNYTQGLLWVFTALTNYNFYYSKLEKIFK